VYTSIYLLTYLLTYLQNDLQLNADKSDVILLGTPYQPAIHIKNITAAGTELPVSSEFKSLGVLLDQQLSYYCIC